MEKELKTLVSMVNVALQGKVLKQEQLANITTGCAKLLGHKESEYPQLIKEVECQVTFTLEEGVLIEPNK